MEHKNKISDLQELFDFIENEERFAVFDKDEASFRELADKLRTVK